jgi:hypothetical protein
MVGERRKPSGLVLGVRVLDRDFDSVDQALVEERELRGPQVVAR